MIIERLRKNKWRYWDVYLQEKNNTVWKATLNVAETKNGEFVLYDIDPIKKVEAGVESPSTATVDSILNNSDDVNTENT